MEPVNARLIDRDDYLHAALATKWFSDSLPVCQPPNVIFLAVTSFLNNFRWGHLRVTSPPCARPAHVMASAPSCRDPFPGTGSAAGAAPKALPGGQDIRGCRTSGGAGHDVGIDQLCLQYFQELVSVKSVLLDALLWRRRSSKCAAACSRALASGRHS